MVSLTVAVHQGDCSAPPQCVVLSALAGGPPWVWRRWGKRRGPGRPPKPRMIWFNYGEVTFVPLDPSGAPIQGEPVFIGFDELEALRLVYYEGLRQEEAAKKMGVSRGTLWRLLDSGRRKIVQALVERRPIVLGSAAVGEE